MIVINEKTLQKLEYQQILERLSAYVVSGYAKRLCLAMRPCDSFDLAHNSLCETQQAMTMYNYQVSPDFSIDDVTEILSRAKVASTLSMRDLLCVMRLLRTSRLLYKSLTTPVGDVDTSILRARAGMLYSDKKLEEDIGFAIISEEEMNDRASDDLYAIRRKIKDINADIQRKLQSYTKQGELSKYLQDSIVTLRGDRYVLPVKQEYKSFVNGILHDQSASGSTVFIEPMAIVQLNNDLRQQLAEEREEIQRILHAFTLQVRAVADRLALTQDTIAQTDVVFAKVKFAADTHSTLPLLNYKGIISLKNARHLLIDSKKVVPISVSLGKDYDLIIVTGPNTGGKTVSLKTVGLITLMALSGMYIPAQEESQVSYFEDIFCDIGDEQSIEQNLSTFSSHIVNLKQILLSCNKNTLVLIDEVGAGTEPNEGAALALAITEKLRKSSTKGIITTHYGQLKEYALSADRVQNASMEFDPNTFAPTYKLVVGVPGSSNAIEIANRLGMDKEVIDYARQSLSGEKVSFEKVIRNAEQLRQNYEKQLHDIEAEKVALDRELEKHKKLNEGLQKERDKLLANSRLEAKQIVSAAQEESKQLIDEIKRILNQSELQEKSLFEARALAKKLNNVATDTDIEDEQDETYFTGDNVDFVKLKIGDKVYSKKLNREVEITSLKSAVKIGIKVGALSSFVDSSDLYYCKTEKRQNNATRSKPNMTAAQSKVKVDARSRNNEINVIGQTVDEAVANVDAFIDSALLAGLNQIWIIHGMGTGRLRQGIHQYLKQNRNVDSFRLGKYGEGESGVTVVTLK